MSVPTFLVVALFLLPAAESAVAIANQLAVMFVKPRALPKMDYSEGIPGRKQDAGGGSHAADEPRTDGARGSRSGDSLSGKSRCQPSFRHC